MSNRICFKVGENMLADKEKIMEAEEIAKVLENLSDEDKRKLFYWIKGFEYYSSVEKIEKNSI